MEAFSEWLKSIGPDIDWAYDDVAKMEKQLVARIKECGYVNLEEILRNFRLNESLKYGKYC